MRQPLVVERGRGDEDESLEPVRGLLDQPGDGGSAHADAHGPSGGGVVSDGAELVDEVVVAPRRRGTCEAPCPRKLKKVRVPATAEA
ncbi:hypothetical protein GCM10025862_28050 [Arsenicicoccus piscis]|uniref:Uncharacterized protein n=1 Tax=Arsenicicoccus piscis TaxID=673954 RepID=A0ABQ6HQP1_9MICO|nr:hypothetical protein GCM10025862_28050 [Arsenicicoccus piscis]